MEKCVESIIECNLYQYTGNNPIVRVDLTGKETWFIGGAGVDGSYIQGMVDAFLQVGIKNVRAAQASYASTGNLVTDAASIIFRNNDRGAYYSKYQGNVNLDVPKGEQLNFIGYSHGSIVAAHSALAIAEGGHKVDNVVLIGAPVNQDLIDVLNNNKNIDNVIVKNLTDVGDKIYAGMSDFEIFKAIPSMMSQMPKSEGHFYYAGDNDVGAARRLNLANDLKAEGVK
jgi:hypothetical protein